MPVALVGTISRFLASGLILNLVGFLFFYIFVEFGVVGEKAALLTSALLLPIAFVSNSLFVFESGLGERRSRVKFMITYIFVMGINYLFLRNVLATYPGRELLAQMLYLLFVVAISFVLQKNWVFRLGTDSKSKRL